MLSGYAVSSRTTPPSAYRFQRAGPAEPRFVVMSTTPLDAAVPYTPLAAGPFRISIDSMSSGFRSLSRFGA